jgi:hypothetical protein
MKKRIKSLKELKEWNANPTKELPIVYDWFMDWFFKDVLMKDKFKLAKDAHETHIEFCMICNNFTREQAIERVNRNMDYYSRYSVEWENKLDKCFPEVRRILN